MNKVSFYISYAISNLILVNSFAEIVRFEIDVEESFLELETSYLMAYPLHPVNPKMKTVILQL